MENEAEEEENETRSQDEPVRGPWCGDGVREDPERSPSGAAGGEYRSMCPPTSILRLEATRSRTQADGSRK